MRFAFVVLWIVGCGASATATPPASATPPPPPTVAEIAGERVCFTGTIDNGVCHLFLASREPLSAVAQLCLASGGQWLAACPTDGRLGECTGPDGDRAVYYGLGLGRDAAQHACEADGHVFTP